MLIFMCTSDIHDFILQVYATYKISMRAKKRIRSLTEQYNNERNEVVSSEMVESGKFNETRTNPNMKDPSIYS